MKKVCKQPFKYMEINDNGKAHFCCPEQINYYCLGNIFEEDIESVWNGEKAQKFRQDLLEQKYTFCRTDVCFREEICVEDRVIIDYPESVRFCYDYFCPQACIMCRDAVSVPSEDEIKLWDSKIETTFIPLLKNAKIVEFNGAGEFFNNEHSKRLAKRISQVYPHIKFTLIANGIYLNEQNLIEYGILDKLDTIGISIHASTKETYDKIVKNGNFDRIKENVEFVSQLKKKGMVKSAHLNFVVISVNYKDMIEFAKWGKRLDLPVSFWSVKRMSNTQLTRELEKYSVFKDYHIDYNNFVKILRHPVLNENFVAMPEEFKNLRPVSIFQVLKNNLVKAVKHG